MSRIIKRGFITLQSGQFVGYIEEMGLAGVIFKHKSINIRTTSSNISSGDRHEYSISKAGDEAFQIAKKAMVERKPVIATFERHLCGSPTVGYTGLLEKQACYITDVKIHDTVDEIKIVKTL
jgi:hypothetical protein